MESDSDVQKSSKEDTINFKTLTTITAIIPSNASSNDSCDLELKDDVQTEVYEQVSRKY